MRKVTYKVNTPKGSVEVKTFARANEIIEEKGGTSKVVLTPVAENPSKISEKKLEWLKSGAKPLHPYKGV